MCNFLLLNCGVFATSFLFTLICVPVFRRIAFATGFLDIPKSEAHKQHGKAIPLLGGAAMFSGFSISLIVTGLFLYFSGRYPQIIDGLKNVWLELSVLSLCATLAFGLGLADDRHSMKAHWKFAGQFLIAVLAVVFGGLRISVFVPNELFSCCVSILWLLIIFNATNFFDNMDGLAAGMAVIAFLMFFLASVVNGQYFAAALCAFSTGAVGAFWIFNSHPASMFMGDAGSHFTGFLVGVVSIKVTYYNPEAASSKLAVLIPLFILAIPLFDAFAVAVIRFYHHKPFWVGDNNHISHRFVRMGYSRAKSVLLVHLLCLAMGLGALPILWGEWKTCLLLFIQGLVFLLIFSLMQSEDLSTGPKGQKDKRN